MSVTVTDLILCLFVQGYCAAMMYPMCLKGVLYVDMNMSISLMSPCLNNNKVFVAC